VDPGDCHVHYFFQAYMVAPIIPMFSAVFHSPLQEVALIVPAYLIPYGVSTLIYGLLADRFGMRRVILASLAVFSLLTALTAMSRSIEQVIVWRMLTGFGAGGVVPMALTLVGTSYSYTERGRPLGWLFGAMAGGMAFGAPLGVVLVPFVGWRGLFLGVAVAGLALLAFLISHFRRHWASTPINPTKATLRELLQSYAFIINTPRGRRTYGYVFINSMFHSGVFAWIGVYLAQRFHLGSVAIGLALLGYGIPGFLFGPFIGRMADRWGRARLLPIGLALSAFAAGLLMLGFPVLLAPLVMMLLSLGYDMTQPLLGGIVTSLGGNRPGQSMGLNVFTLFVGFGVGSLIFGQLLHFGFEVALGAFGAIELAVALVSIHLFRSELPSTEFAKGSSS
jgi:predicted MFS family arabinose efflux permease